MEVTFLKLFLRKFNTIRMLNSLGSYVGPGPKGIKFYSCSTKLSTKFILLINVKIPTTVGILTLIGMINTTSERLSKRVLYSSVF